ncbi:MAG: DUF5777 family beta-barrel protein [Vicinamibacterales bacterium]
MLNVRFRRLLPLALATIVVLVTARVSSAQNAAAPTSAAAQAADDDDAVLDPVEPDFRVVDLPTTARLPRGKGNFALTHRFAGNLRRGSFTDNASHLFGIDEGATVGFEYRIGVARHLQAVAYRMSFNQTIQLYAKYDALHEGNSTPVSVSALLSDEGVNNYQDNHAPALGLTISRKLGGVAAVYVVPTWVHNSAAGTGSTLNTTYVGIGSRVRIRPTVYLAAEVSPRLSGYKPGSNQFGFAVEKRAGGHMFQLNFTNAFGTTFSQIARGASPRSLSLGFNLSRKFY